MKVRSSLTLMVLLACSYTQAAIPGNKRTIFTSGEKVYPIRYQLGQSTVVDLGAKPEVVICGNKNYFNIEKLKNGITIQPLSQFSTNLTVLSGSKRFLFYLVPANGQSPDGFIDVKWIPLSEQRSVSNSSQKVETQIDLNQKVKIDADIELTIVRAKFSSTNSRRIFDLHVKSKKSIALKDIELTVLEGNTVIQNQALVWEKDNIEEKSTSAGRLILTKLKTKDLTISIKFRGKITKLKIKGAKN